MLSTSAIKWKTKSSLERKTPKPSFEGLTGEIYYKQRLDYNKEYNAKLEQDMRRLEKLFEEKRAELLEM